MLDEERPFAMYGQDDMTYFMYANLWHKLCRQCFIPPPVLVFTPHYNVLFVVECM